MLRWRNNIVYGSFSADALVQVVTSDNVSLEWLCTNLLLPVVWVVGYWVGFVLAFSKRRSARVVAMFP